MEHINSEPKIKNVSNLLFHKYKKYFKLIDNTIAVSYYYWIFSLC